MALALLDTLDKEYTRLADAKDVEALHDFRVALRRLRSWLRAYRGDIKDSVGKKAMKRLGALARATTDSRDIEVHLEWLAAQETGVDRAARHGVRLLKSRLTADRRRADAAFREALGAEFTELSAKLRKNLSRYAVAVWDRGDDDRWARSAATGIQEAFVDFRRRLAAVQEIRDDDALHRARIEGKRLRYLVEPLAGHVDGAAGVVESLKRAQDLLGSVHDSHVFARSLRRFGRGLPAKAKGSDPRIGVRALTARLNGRRTAAWKSFAHDWREREFTALSSAVHDVVRGLRDIGGAGVEIERKYLLRKLPRETGQAPFSELEQGYLPGTVLVERVRRTKTGETVKYTRTVKAGSGLVRTEIEEPCTFAVFKSLWPLTKGKRIRKKRYRLADAGHVWEIDQFLDRKLVLAEVELDSAKDEVAIPDWLARCVVREVTTEPEYLNHTLAR